MINGKLVVDNFAGGGGASTGIEMATGISVDIAINHDPEAIKMHKMNHPSTKHYCESVWDVNPIEACNGRPVALAWFSPDCKHFSKAKGGKPKDKNIRGLAWVALRWAGTVRPDVIMLENVEEFKTWGPLNRRHRPIKSKQGVTFNKFISQLEDLGYVVEYRELIAADYGAPTMRKRFFLIARCDGKPIVWPEPTHGKSDSEEVKAGLLEPYVGAHTQIDFSLPCPSIFDTSEEIKAKYGIRAVRPLKPKTMERIARGLKKFVLDNSEPFIIPIGYGEKQGQLPRVHDIKEPLPTIVSSGKHYLCEPYLAQCKFDNEAQEVTKPIGTLTTVGSHMLVEPYMVQIGQTGFTDDRSKDVREPLTTIVSKNEHCLIEPKLAPIIDKAYGGNYQGNGSSVDEPIDTITTVDHNRLVEAKLMPFMGVNTTNHPGGKADEPLHTITTGGQNCLITPTLIQYHSETSCKEVRGQSIEEPIMTVDGSNRYGLVQSFLSKCYDPQTYACPRLHLQPPDSEEVEKQLSSSCLVHMNNHCDGRNITEPIPTIVASDGHFAEVRAFLIKYYGQGTGQELDEPLDTIPTHDRFGLVTVNGVDYQIVDIGLRMLEPKELYGCQGFPEDYIIDRDYEGKKYPRSEQVRRCGNSVCPPIPAALVRANLPELCVAERTKNMQIGAEENGQLSFVV